MSIGNVQFRKFGAISPFVQTRNIQINRNFALGLESFDRELSPQVCSTEVAKSDLGNRFDSNNYFATFGR